MTIVAPGAGTALASVGIGSDRALPAPVYVHADGVWTPVSATVPMPVTVGGAVAVSGPLPDAQLRAAPVQVVFGAAQPVVQSGSWTVGVSGTVAVSGPLTNSQLRASAVEVTGPLTDGQLRASPISVAQSGAWTVSLSGPVAVGSVPHAARSYVVLDYASGLVVDTTATSARSSLPAGAAAVTLVARGQAAWVRLGGGTVNASAGAGSLWLPAGLPFTVGVGGASHIAYLRDGPSDGQLVIIGSG